MSELNNFVKSKEDPLIRRLVMEFGKAESVDINVAFAFSPGVRLLSAHIEDLILRGTISEHRPPIRVLIGDYLDATDPHALRQLLDMGEGMDLRVFETSSNYSFHPKAFIIHYRGDRGSVYIGSSNLSRQALEQGIEWNYRIDSEIDGLAYKAIREEFEVLFNCEHVTTVTEGWIKDYEARRNIERTFTPSKEEFPITDFELPDELPVPRPIQKEALQALHDSRERKEKAGLVVLATGLGKTYLAAFDCNKYKRILFVAHREEILYQASKAFRTICPSRSIGFYKGDRRDRDVEILFASVQTLSRLNHLNLFQKNEFDYIIIDEFHHADASTYRRLIEYFEPDYLLGLTATPERMDGGDILALCDENLVYQCDLIRGIDERQLSPFHYFGVPDDIDYGNIPWRNGKFDQYELTNAWAIESRAENAFEQLSDKGGDRVLCFCSSIEHTDYMGSYFKKKGKQVAVVHSQNHSDSRAESLDRLERGELDIICAVDIFNEGVDIPLVDTVLMLRPTESPTIWAQQFGRGLRFVKGKTLKVIDYIGNHKSFLVKAKTLLSVNSDRELKHALKLCDENTFELPEGCSVTYDLESMSILKQLVDQKLIVGNQASQFYDEYKEKHDSRPLAIHAFNAGVLPCKRGGYKTWFNLVEIKNDHSDDFMKNISTTCVDFINEIERTSMTKSFKMILLKGLLKNGLEEPTQIKLLRNYFRSESQLNDFLKFELGDRVNSDNDLDDCIRDNPINAWTSRLDSVGNEFFMFEDNVIKLNFQIPDQLQQQFVALVTEMVDYRLAKHWPSNQALVFGETYSTNHIKLLFKSIEMPGNWMSGYIRLDGHKLLLVTLDKDERVEENLRYADKVIDKDTFQWESPSGTTIDSSEGKSIVIEDASPFHLFIRERKIERGLTQPYFYCGEIQLKTHKSEQPIRCMFKLKNSLPNDLFERFKVASGSVE